MLISKYKKLIYLGLTIPS